MKNLFRRSVVVLFAISIASMALGDGIEWQAHQGELEKAGFNGSAAAYDISSDSGQVGVSLRLTPLESVPGLFSYSKWEIDRWGDPQGELVPEGSWHVVSNSANDVVLGLWGYWGWTGEADGPRIKPGDETSYQLSLRFERPVEDLSFSLHGINAVLREDGFNSMDILSIQSFLQSEAQSAPIFEEENIGYVRNGDELVGDFAHPVNGQGASTNDLGSVKLAFPSAVDEVTIRFTSRADHPDVASFGDELQGWAFSLGDLAFNSIPDVGSSQIDWTKYQGELVKEGYDRSSASYQVVMEGGTVVDFEMSHTDTSANLFSYSKWEIDRWGDPEGVALAPGSWQVVSNATNDVVLGLWGYWGWDGDPGSKKVKRGDQTSYQLAIRFDRPVSQLSIPLHGINALLREDGFNSIDYLHITPRLNGQTSSPPSYLRKGKGVVVHGASELSGDFDNQIGEGFAGQNMTDDGSVELRFGQAVDEVVITLVNRADHPLPQAFSNGLQSWSFSVGNISFVPGVQTTLDWDDYKGELVKEDFDVRPANAHFHSRDGLVDVDIDLEHLGTSPGLFSYNKWEVDSWGDPDGIHAEQGSWQIVSNGSNEVVLGMWGYWGWDGQEETPRVQVGDSTSHRVTIQFNHPVDQLSFMLNGINALIKDLEGFNSQDVLTVESYLGSTQQGEIVYRQEGDAFTRSDNVLSGDYTVQINESFSGQHISDRGSLRLVFADTVDRVVLTLVNVAGHHDLAQFQGGAQTWSYSVGDLSFVYSDCADCSEEDPDTGEQTDGGWAARAPTLEVILGSEGEVQLHVSPRANSSLEGFDTDYTIEGSSDLLYWGALGAKELETMPTEGATEIWTVRPGNGSAKQRYFRLRKH